MKAKWTYIESETLGQTIAFDEASRWLFCKDGTRYSPVELYHITDGWRNDAELPLEVHLIKKVFEGEIYEKKTPGLAAIRRPRTKGKLN